MHDGERAAAVRPDGPCAISTDKCKPLEPSLVQCRRIVDPLGALDGPSLPPVVSPSILQGHGKVQYLENRRAEVACHRLSRLIPCSVIIIISVMKDGYS